ncbi:ABC transporter ATP-binding protein [Opitutaceae bacterium EW11]|nr:ABC transporter ATP-binding protein [Opitutaceae bacterium EW11]
MLTIKSVTKRYGDLVALNDVSLEIAPGEFFGLLGPNGAGKSTLMSLVSGLRAADSGDIFVSGQNLRDASGPLRHELGLVPQSIALYTDLSAQQNLELFGQLYGLRGKELRRRVDEALDAAQLTERRRDAVKTFSGGMQRRLNISASLLHRPKLLLCDEPTVGVDPQSRNAIFDHLQRLNREGITIIYSTHYMEEAERLCSRIGIIDHGRILALGSLDTLLAQLPFEDEITFPAKTETEALAGELGALGEITTIDGTHRFRPPAGFPLSRFFALAEARSLSPRLFTSRRPTLEALFLHLTGRTLRD